MLIASRALWFYAGKLAWPTDLSVIYPRWNISLGDPWAWLYLAAAMALAAVLWFGRHRIGRGPLAGALFFAVTLSPALGFVNYGYMQYSLVADRFQYLAGIGVMAVIIGAAVHGGGRFSGGLRMGAMGLPIVLLALLGTTTWRQTGLYRDNVTLFTHIISLNPEARNAHRILGLGLNKAGRLEEALSAATIAAERRPDDARSYSLLGTILVKLQRLDKAEENYRRALELDPRNREILKYLSTSYSKQKRYQEALDLYRKLSEVEPDNAKTHNNIGAILSYLGQSEAAVRSFKHALSLDPTLEGARNGLEEARKRSR